MLNANHFRTSDTGIIVRSNHTAAYEAAHTWESEEHKKNEAVNMQEFFEIFMSSLEREMELQENIKEF